ncbi:MAG: hypothetical protein EOL97_08600 [Spirochaetia bacterium]|nr:hypothetical protein [Spirochaetia bacterium]
MNKLQFWWNKSILRKDIVRKEEGFNVYGDKFFKIESDSLDFISIYEYQLVDKHTAFRDEMELPNDKLIKVTHNKVITALVNRDMLVIDEKGRFFPGEKSVHNHVYYNDKTFVFAYDVDFKLNLYDISI